jgi:TolB-like protein/Tfp pilus assembly protein PilF
VGAYKRSRPASTWSALLFLVVVGKPNGLHAQCPDGSPPPCARPAAPARQPPPNSIAVLPFANRSPDTADVYLAEGMTDEVGNRLAQLGRFQVKARGLVRAQLRRTPEPLDASRALGVAWFLAGNVRYVGGQLLVNVELVRATTGDEVWAARFPRNAADVFAVQSEVAESVTVIVAGRLTPSERAVITRRPTRNKEAYRLSLYGNTLLDRRSRLDARRAAEAFTEAVRLDPGFANAWASLSLARGVQYAWEDWVENIPKDSLLRLQEVAARTALRLDSVSSEAWLAFGSTQFHKGEFDAAHEAYEHAIHLDSLNAEAFHFEGILYSDENLDDYEAAAPLYRSALALDPGLRNTWRHLAMVTLHAGRFAVAEDLLDTTLAYGWWPVALYNRAYVRFVRGNAAGALADLAQAESIDSVSRSDDRARYSLLLGDSTAARAVLSRLRGRADSGQQVLDTLAGYAMALGLQNEALTALERLRARRNPREPRCGPSTTCSASLQTWDALHDPIFAPLKGDPRFERLWEETRPRVPWLKVKDR